MTARMMSSLLTAVFLAATARSGEDRQAAWDAPDPAEIKSQVLAWLDQVQADTGAREAVHKLWADAPDATDEVALLDRVVDSAALVDPRVRQLLDDCRRARPISVLPSHDWLLGPGLPPLVAHNLRLWYGRYLAQESYYDEALRQLENLQPEQVTAPATLLFYQAVVYQRLLDRDRGLLAVELLLQNAASGPQRYAALAKLMREDLKGLEEDTLDHIARRMDDIRRRLGLGQAGPKVREVEDGVIASLDKLIKEIEDQQQQQQSGGGGAGSNQPITPASDSRLLGGKGPGEVVKRNIGSGSGWGNLPPKDREEAMQQVGREFPSHYHEIIEQYFRKLAGEGSDQ